MYPLYRHRYHPQYQPPKGVLRVAAHPRKATRTPQRREDVRVAIRRAARVQMVRRVWPASHVGFLSLIIALGYANGERNRDGRKLVIMNPGCVGSASFYAAVVNTLTVPRFSSSQVQQLLLLRMLPTNASYLLGSRLEKASTTPTAGLCRTHFTPERLQMMQQLTQNIMG